MVNNTKIQIDSTSSGDYPLRVMLWQDHAEPDNRKAHVWIWL